MLTLLFLFQCEGVSIVRSHVAKQHWRVCRIKTHPNGEPPRVTESLEIDNAFVSAIRNADSKHSRIIIPRAQAVNELAIGRPRAKLHSHFGSTTDHRCVSKSKIFLPPVAPFKLAMKRPLGDHLGDHTPSDPGSVVIWWLARSRSRTTEWKRSIVSSAEKTILCPSGDQLGSLCPSLFSGKGAREYHPARKSGKLHVPVRVVVEEQDLSAVGRPAGGFHPGSPSTLRFTSFRNCQLISSRSPTSC